MLIKLLTGGGSYIVFAIIGASPEGGTSTYSGKGRSAGSSEVQSRRDQDGRMLRDDWMVEEEGLPDS